ncbi:hypothetical protein BW721_07935 [Jeotgalibaca sp. PTS2502]|uniref:DUF1129 domain-containing protein n=1 Tax=Jeotgalibaca sp. PTS2502 TaxID=1903686 RepID=UPI000973DE20|nr:DUF1129 family protein [Jeotgalibaca sp. PTS2502]APZ49593.1 hypothetical protein BW721_07935 [Jeotgalibaca sp. PTS2502]
MAETNTQQTKEELQAANTALWEQLTKRNEQYMLGLDKVLTAANYDDDKRATLYNQMMTELAENQKTGVTARQLYGTVSECAERILQQPEKAPGRSSDFLIAMDGGLLLGSMFALISGISLFTADGADAQKGMGIISLLINFIIGGLAMLIISKFTPNPDAPKGKRGYGKYILATTGAMLIWMLAMTLATAFIPVSINRALPAVAYLIIAGVGFAAKIYFKKRLRITGGIF